MKFNLKHDSYFFKYTHILHSVFDYITQNKTIPRQPFYRFQCEQMSICCYCILLILNLPLMFTAIFWRLKMTLGSFKCSGSSNVLGCSACGLVQKGKKMKCVCMFCMCVSEHFECQVSTVPICSSYGGILDLPGHQSVACHG